MTTKTTISNTDDVIDIRDVIERVEELEELMPDDASQVMPGTSDEVQDVRDELQALNDLLESCAGYGGDEQWRGDWYPVTLIRDTYFQDYAEQLADEIGAIDTKASWPMTCIDWEVAARELQYDYTGVEFDGVTYWTR